ncbi:beta-3-deoxy-D-manno-oct-2-ulosonic acid transferase [Sphingobium lactosutens]|uniref:capsular polysaccharide export protein, LipB/KpsS family n=1 Tax=Sphingobium lactosutens TaxID=522773 RepID=UPI0015B81E99|nr:beta-3-deoxy-D-manno-oct-2-ulosonic acid transferase [Sphingobium lactosutens]NWK95038.1 beta-3-deoxy-D-manno-oct-2-ulosonic acid transferase [Sphingobium lactosutens]
MLPFLRSPPFPHVAPSVAAVSTAIDDGRAGAFVPDGVLDAIVEARVGGAFWGERTAPVRLLVRMGIGVDPAALSGVQPDQIGLLPGAGPTPTVGRILSADCDPWAMIDGVQALHATEQDEWALVAGLLDVPVIGPDGKRIDPGRLRDAARTRIALARYRNPFTGDPTDAAAAILHLADWRRHLDGNRDIAAASGMAFWKRDAVRRFLWDGRRSPPFLSAARGLRRAQREKGALAVWPSRVPKTMAQDAADRAVPLVRVEDGFIRSRGLGAALHPPGSVVVDRTGIYYNALAENDLETLLATHDFPLPLVERAARLRRRICSAGVTKYGQDSGRMLALPEGRRTVLAIGQVDDDLSVRLGGAGVEGNLDFLARVRGAEPDAWIVYRPHPDVQAGHRKGHVSDAAILTHADAIDGGAPLMELVQAVDEVHVLSSLTGFEALMRGRSVTVHGMPFYAGWGLTRDLARPCARRGRQLTLDQLVAAALILYPRYLDVLTQLPCGPEIMVERMANGTTPAMTSLIRLRQLQGKLRRFMTLSAEYLHG